MAASATSLEYVQKMYIAYFGRPAAPIGLEYYGQLVDAGNVAALQDDFWNSAESQALFSQPTTEGKVNAIFNQLFGRDAAPSGLTYWTVEINAGRVSLPAAALTILNSAAAADADVFNAKMDVANAFTGELDTTSEILAYQSNTAGGRTTLSAIETQAAADAAVASIDTIVAVVVAGGSSETDTFTLTNGTDIKTAHIFTSNLVYTPGGDDRINSLQDEDQLSGTNLTDDRLDATLGNANDNGGTVITPKLTGVEKINVGFTGSGAFNVTALDLQDATEVTEINITRVSQGKSAEVGNIKQDAATLSLHNTNANQADTVEFTYAAGVLAGEKTGTMTLDNVDLGFLNIGQNITITAQNGVITNGFEHLNLVSTGSANTVRTLNLPMDTGTNGSIAISGDQNLTLATTTNITNVGLAEAVSHAGGVVTTNGRLESIDASGMTGTAALALTISAGLLSTGKADTSGQVQNVTITGSGNADTFYLYDTVQAGDKLLGGLGTDTVVIYTGGITTGTVTGIEAIDIQAVANVTVDLDKISDAATINIRNIDNDQALAPTSADRSDITVTLNNLTATQGAALSIQHSTTTNGGITDTTVAANLKSSTNANDLVGITIAEGVNADPRFNFTLQTNPDLVPTAAVERVESITITDSDSESNTVELSNTVAVGAADHTGTITLTGGVAGTFLNLDVSNTALAPADQTTAPGLALLAAVTLAKTNFDSAPTVTNRAILEQALLDAAATTGLKQVNVTGSAADGLGWTDVGAAANAVRLVAGTIDATGEAADVTVRVSTTAANTNGGQSIKMGAGNDTVIFDDVAATSLTRANAGLTNADTVSGGAGNNTLVIDGDGVNVVLQQSEWDNVSGFQTIYTAGNGVGNQYFLQLDNDMIIANGTGGNMITIDNDDDSTVFTSAYAGTAATATAPATLAKLTNVDDRISNTAVRLDATTLSAATHFTYDGEEGSGATRDRFVVNDQNTNGGNIIDGGDINVSVAADALGVTRQLTGNRSLDVLEVRNTATVTTADLTNVQNVGSIVINNDQAVLQTLNLSLNTTVADALSDSGHTATLTETEALLITANDGLMADAAGSAIVPTAASRIVMDARGISGAFALTVQGDATFAANDTVSMAVNLGGTASTFNLAAGTADAVSFFGLNATGGNDAVVITSSGVTSGLQTLTFSNAGTTSTQNFALTSVEVVNLLTSAGAAAAMAGGVTFVASAIADVIAGTQLADTINGLAGNDTISGNDGTDIITGGVGYDVMTGGAGVDTFVFAPGDSATPTSLLFDTITDYRTGGDSVIDFTAALAVGTQSNVAGAGVATVAASGVLTFNVADTSLAQHLVAAQAALSGGAANRAVAWQEGADAYVYVDDGVPGVGPNDVLIQLTGVTLAAGGFTFFGGNITAIA